MSQEVYEMITRLDRERIETHLVVQCAPMISGMKVSNLLNVEKKLAPQMKQVLERSGISYYLLLESEDKATFLVYREDGLQHSFQAQVPAYGKVPPAFLRLPAP